jgi:hypothetical protein
MLFPQTHDAATVYAWLQLEPHRREKGEHEQGRDDRERQDDEKQEKIPEAHHLGLSLVRFKSQVICKEDLAVVEAQA